MAKKDFYMVIDVEGTGEPTNAFVYDVGGKIVDRQGNEYERFSFVVSDIFENGELMSSAYYFEKIPKYYDELANNRTKKISFYHIRKYIINLMIKYGVKEVFAYNAVYDRNALNNTLANLTNNKYRYFFPYGTKISCIWYMACQVLCTKKSYYVFCVTNNFVSNAGNIRTSAEVVYAYLTNNVIFEEKHMGVYDSDIESEILLACFKRKKKMQKGIKNFCWKIPQRKKKKG
jgi:hypothetical protein